MSEIEREIKKIISQFQQLPYLFIGTGLSMRYASAPSWDELLFFIWKLIENDDRIKFEKNKQRIEYEIKSELPNIVEDDKKYYINPQLATELQYKFNLLYYNNEEFDRSLFTKDESDEIIGNKIDPFKFYICKLIRGINIDESKKEYDELKFLIKNQNKIGGVITTNYDKVIENILTNFEILVGQENMLLSNTNNIFEIFKIHGSVDIPNSIVFTKKDYQDFNEKLKYLSAKLLTIFVEHPIIFIGYGFGDFNIIKLFEEISSCLNFEQLERTKKNFIFLTPSIDGKENINTKEFRFGNKKIFMTEITLDNYTKFYNELSNIESNIPIHLARKLQDMVCNYIYSSSITNNILFGDINSPDLDDNKAAVYFGTKETVSQIGFDYYTIDTIIEDILFDNRPLLTNRKLITCTFRNIRSNAGSTLLPVHKYLRSLKMDINEIPRNYNIIRSYTDIIPNKTELSIYVDKDANYTSMAEILEEHPNHILKQIANIKQYASKIEIEDLGNYLRDCFNNGVFFENSKHSAFKRLAALYDFKKNYSLIK